MPKFVVAFSHIPRGLQIALAGSALILVAYAACLLLIGTTFPGRYAGDRHPESHIVQLPGGPVRYVEQEGTAGAHPLLLLHGYQGTLSQWNATWERLDPCGLHRIRIDIPGFGESVWNSNDFSLDAQAERVAAFLDHLGIHRIVLAGTSMGASLAATFAARYPERVERLALFAPSAYPGSLTYGGLYGLLVKPGSLNTFARFIARTWPFRKLFPTSIAIETLTVTASYDQDWAASLARIRAPTLVAWSRRDGTANPSAAPKVHAAIRGSYLLMLDEETGHSVPGARPQLTAALLCELATGVPVHEVFSTEVVRRELRAGEVALLPLGAFAQGSES